MTKLLICLPCLIIAAACEVGDRPTNKTTWLDRRYVNIRDNYSYRYPTGYEVKGFTDYGNVTSSTPQDSSTGVEANGSAEFVFQVTEPPMSDAALTPQRINDELAKNGLDPAKYTISPVRIAGFPGFKVVHNFSTDSVGSTFYEVQLRTGRIIGLVIATNSAVAEAIFDSFVLMN